MPDACTLWDFWPNALIKAMVLGKLFSRLERYDHARTLVTGSCQCNNDDEKVAIKSGEIAARGLTG